MATNRCNGVKDDEVAKIAIDRSTNLQICIRELLQRVNYLKVYLSFSFLAFDLY